MISPEMAEMDCELYWQQACEALARDDYDAALRLLDTAQRQVNAPADRARLALYMASIHALYGEHGVADLQQMLVQAQAADPSGEGRGLLAQALKREWEERAQPNDARVVQPPLYWEQAEPLARFHAFCAMMLAGQPQEALEIDLPMTDLPEHLRWRLRSWQADAQETLGQTQDAAHLYAEAAHLTRGLNRAVMLQEQAALLLNLGQADDTRRILAQARPLYTGQDVEETLNLATWHYLNAQALLQLGQPETAHHEINEAARLEALGGEKSYGVVLVRGQVLNHLGQPEAALSAFEEALNLAAEPDKPFALHELGVALLDLDRPVEAREKLEAVLNVPDYPYQPEVMADMAECDYRLGRLQDAEILAQQALALGAVIPASLVLGSVAMDYYHLDEALEHYERVIREAVPESREWVVAHQMAADVLAQQGFPNPAQAYAYAQQALAHTPDNDDWHVTLTEHLRKAAERLESSSGRMLN